MRCSFDCLLPLILRARKVEGAFVEMGVFWGQTLVPMSHYLLSGGDTRPVYGIDSFDGMGKPTEKDFDQDATKYPEGCLKSDMDWVRQSCPENVRLLKGWVPQVLDKCPETQVAFCHIDLDQFQPTLEGLRWAWPRLVPGGVIAIHDWFPAENIYASGGVKAFLEEQSGLPSGAVMAPVQTSCRHAVIVRPHEGTRR